jgi:hypothetical protein
MHQLPILDITGAQGMAQRGQHEIGVRAHGGGPADDLVGERIPHAGQPQHPLPGHDPGQIGHPQPVRRTGGEVPVHQIRRDGVPRVLPGGTALPPLRRNAPCSPCSPMIRSTRLRPHRTPWRRSASHTRADPYVPANSCPVPGAAPLSRTEYLTGGRYQLWFQCATLTVADEVRRLLPGAGGVPGRSHRGPRMAT